jgi:serine/threonine-protein kinase
MGVLNRVCHAPHTPVWRVNSEIPDELSDVIDRLLEKKQWRRYANASDVKDVLSRILVELQQRGIRRRPRWVRTVQRNRFWVLAFSLLMIGGLYFLPLSWTQPKKQQITKASGAESDAAASDAKTPTAEVATPITSRAALAGLQQLETLTTPQNSELEAIDKQLNTLESKVSSSRFITSESNRFWDDAKTIESRLNQIEESLFSSLISQTREGTKK